MRALRAFAILLGMSACLADAALAQGVTVRILNDTPINLRVTIRDLDAQPPQDVLSGEVINGNASITLSVTADAFEHGRVSWTATTVDRDMRRCAHRRNVRVRNGATLHVFANRYCPGS